jgi:uridine phosphorylase
LKPIAHSELIINKDGSIYHLNLKPGDIAETIITVGDPDRVAAVSKYFDTIEFSNQKREFKTQTGTYKGKRITVISTGIGTDNIDIVFNELDALVNIDFKTKTIKKKLTKLTFIRIGTSGAIQRDIPVDSFLISEKAIGFDNLLHFYNTEELLDTAFSKALRKHCQWNPNNATPYLVPASKQLLLAFNAVQFQKGCTATNVGFYGPQGRALRLTPKDENLNSKLESFEYQGTRITNLEMETSAIYGLAILLGHEAISLNAILANRPLGTFSADPNKTVDQLIITTLNVVAKNT